MIRKSCHALLLASGLCIGPIGLARAADEALSLRRPDGSQIAAYLDRQGHTGRQGILVLAQGSGCGSVQVNENIQRGKQLILPDFAVLTVEDYGVRPKDPDQSAQEKCPVAFYGHHTISQRVADYEQALASLESRPWWNGQLVLFGGSEGGAAVQELAPRVKAGAVVVFSSATGVKFRDSFIQVLPPPVATEAKMGLDDVKRHPASSKLLLGNSYVWWSDIMDRRLSDDLLRAHEPILVVQGQRDQSNPVASARALRSAFAQAGKSNLTYWELAGLDHHMKDAAGGDHVNAVLARISAWIKTQLAAGGGITDR